MLLGQANAASHKYNEVNTHICKDMPIFPHLPYGFPDDLVGKESTCSGGDTRDVCLIPGLGRFPGGGNGNPLQCSCLKSPRDRGAWWATVHGVSELDGTEQLDNNKVLKVHPHR